MQRNLTPTAPALVNDMHAALLRLDSAYMRAYFPGAPEQELLTAMHKARYHCQALPREARHQSALWLRERGLPGMDGEPVLPEGRLPL